MTIKKAIILTGDGINCERETARAFHEAGAVTTIVHVNDFLKNPKQLLQYQIFALPGGFSFGDELRSGKILAEKMRHQMIEILKEFKTQGGLTIGICNGFQVLVQLGAFSDDFTHDVTLATNDHGQFLDQWTTLQVTETGASSVWFKNMEGLTLAMPIRHKEGRIVCSAQTIKSALRYIHPVNGSMDQSAALLDSSGQTLGLMPHPEAATHVFLHPEGLPVDALKNAEWIKQIFRNACQN